FSRDWSSDVCSSDLTQGNQVESGELVPATELLRRIGPVQGLAKIMSRLGMGAGEESPGHAAAALEFTLEGLYLMRRLSKDDLDRSEERRVGQEGREG